MWERLSAGQKQGRSWNCTSVKQTHDKSWCLTKSRSLSHKTELTWPGIEKIEGEPRKRELKYTWWLLAPTEEAQRINNNTWAIIWWQLLLWPPNHPRIFFVILLSPDTYKIINFQRSLAKSIHYKDITVLWLGLRNRWSNFHILIQTTVTKC